MNSDEPTVSNDLGRRPETRLPRTFERKNIRAGLSTNPYARIALGREASHSARLAHGATVVS